MVEGAVLLWKWMIAALLGGGLVLRSFYALLEGEVEGWQAVLGMSLGLVLTVMAVSLAASLWYYPVLVSIILAGVVAYMLGAIESRIRERRMLEDDAARFLQAIEFDEKNAAAHAFLARVYRKQGKLQDAVGEYERAVELDPHDQEARSDLRYLLARMQQADGPIRCPRCETPFDAAGKTCPECGWSRSTIKGLRDVYASGALKRALLYGLSLTAGVGIISLLLGVSVEYTLTFLLVGWLAWVVLYFWWLLRDVV